MTEKERYLWKLKRRGKGITLEEIADAIGYSLSMIGKFENNERNMRPNMLEKYKDYIENKIIEWESA